MVAMQQNSSHTPRPRDQGGAFLSYGFRPFFLLGALYAGLSVLVWLPIFNGTLKIASAFPAIDWHAHEMIFGFLGAILTGFLFTAIPNWTGRLPIRGAPLLALAVLWAAGRFALLFSEKIGWSLAMGVDCAFLATLTAAITREIFAGRNWRNLMVVAPIAILFLANLLFHLEVQISGASGYSRRLALSAVLVLILIIGGRIIPSFTRNWIVHKNPGRQPTAFNRFDKLTLLVSGLALLHWTFTAEGNRTAFLLLIAAVLNFVRLARWAGDRTLRDRLVFILHLAYFFVPLGMALAGLAAFDPIVPEAAFTHVFGVGAIGTMTLAVMTRATLGHTGRGLSADWSTQGIYAAILLAALTRGSAALFPEQTFLLHLSAGLWVLAYLGFCCRYGRALLTPRLSPHTPMAPPSHRG